MATPEQIIRSGYGMGEALEQATDKHLIRLRKSIRDLQDRITLQFKDLTTTDAGKLVGPRVNLKQAQQIHKDLIKVFDEQYGEVQRRGISKSFDEIAVAIDGSFKELDVAMQYTKLDRDMINTLKVQAYTEFETYGQAAQDQISAAMYDQIAARGPWTELVATMDGILIGGFDKRGGSMAAYSELWANEAIMNYHQQVHLKKAEDAGLEHFLYFGNIMQRSRPFCIDRAGKVYSKAQIESWNSLNWQGKAGPPLIRRGGWNCRHHWQPVDPEWIPEDGLKVGDFFEEEGITIERGTTIPAWAGPKPKPPKPKKVRLEPTGTGATRWVPPDGFHGEASEWSQQMYKAGQEYHALTGLNPSGVIADNIVELLQAQGRNGRVMLTTYRPIGGSTTADDLFNHFIAVELDETGKIIRTFDMANEHLYKVGRSGIEDLAAAYEPKLPEYWPQWGDDIDLKRMAPEIFEKGKWARDTSALYDMSDHEWFYGKMANPGELRAARKLEAEAAASGYKQFKTLPEAEAWARAHGAPTLPKTQTEAYGAYLKYYDKTFGKLADDTLRTKHLDQWFDNFEGIEDISESAFLRMQNAINQNYANPAYLREAGLLADDAEDIVIMLKKQVAHTTESGRNLGDVTMVWDKGMRRYPPKALIPGENLSWRQAVLRHERAHKLWADMDAATHKNWLDIFDSVEQGYWQKNISQYAGTNAEEMFSELFSTVTDPKFIDDFWRYDSAVKALIKKEFPDVFKDVTKAVDAGTDAVEAAVKQPKVGFKPWKPATTKAQAVRQIKDIIAECERRDIYAKVMWGDEAGNHFIRYRHDQAWDWAQQRTKGHGWKAARIHNTFKTTTKNTLGELNAIGRKLDELQRRASLLEIPPLRGAYTTAKKFKKGKGWAANMGDGVMGIHHNTFGWLWGKLEFDPVKYGKQLTAAVDTQRELLKTIAQLEGKQSAAYKAVKEQIALKTDELRLIDEGTWEGPAFGTGKNKPTKWRPGDAVADRPENTEDYLPDYLDKGDMIMEHEYGHHIHQQLFVDGDPKLMPEPPLEIWCKYFETSNPTTAPGIQKLAPSRYATENWKEWFAENYSCWQTGKKHVVNEELWGVFEGLDDIASGKMTPAQLKVKMFDGGDFARPIPIKAKGVYKEVAEDVAEEVDTMFYKTVAALKRDGQPIDSWSLKKIMEADNPGEVIYSWDIEKALKEAVNRGIVEKKGTFYAFKGPGAKEATDKYIQAIKAKYHIPEGLPDTSTNIRLWDAIMGSEYKGITVLDLGEAVALKGGVVRTFLAELKALDVVREFKSGTTSRWVIKRLSQYKKGGD
jgi:hypothetical protein